MDAAQTLSRGERKQRTRVSLQAAALHLMDEGGSFSSLSLREVAREAGVVPTAFYRHFATMDALAMALVKEGGETLRGLLREARTAGRPDVSMVRRSVQTFQRYVEANRLHMLFIARERLGGTPALRKAVHEELDEFAREMAQDLQRLGFMPHLHTTTLEGICGLVVHTMINATSDILDAAREAPEVKERLVEGFVFQLHVIFLGALQWRERTPPPLPASPPSAQDLTG